MTCLSLVLMLALALLGQLTTVAGDDDSDDDSAEKTCDLNKISVMEDFDPSSIEGIWYPKYKSHITAVDNNVDLVICDFKYWSFTDEFTGQESILSANWTFNSNNECNYNVIVYNVNTTGRATADYAPYYDADNMIKYDYYILGVDSNVLLYYELMTYNGEVYPDYSLLVVMVRDPQKAVTLCEAMKRKLRTFCGPTAADISFFQKCPYKYDAFCATWDD